ncbi:hypothetical protein BDF14DRAFT_1732218 [Spinellus fusiger]|nr:hypothetical protein BDF14DRAFT_1732218 [Spinellus fusiger]
MIASLRPIHHLATVSSKTPHRSSPRVLVLTDGSIESAIKAVSLGKQLANGPHHLETKTVVANKVLDLFPPILQKYWVDWAFHYLICSGVSAIPACLYVKKHQSKKIFSVFLGYPIIPFIHFDQVVLPKYEANAKMAALGPLARQRNCILTEVRILPASLSNNPTSSDLTTVVVGGYASECRWYSEDAVTLVDILKRTILHLKTHLVIVFTEKTTPMVKDVIRKGIDQLEKEQRESVSIWDSMLSKDTHTTLERVDMYESLIAKSNRIITTADLDYLTAHASSRRYLFSSSV